MLKLAADGGARMITGIGSLPFTHVDEAIDHIFLACREAPFWPQLPKRSFLEDMYVQFLEQVPAVIIDEQGQSVFVDTAATEGIERFYEDVASHNLEAFRISEAAAPGLYRLLERLPEIIDHVKIIKGQLTGPFTIGLGLKDERGQPIIYNNAYFDIIKKALHMKAAWMISCIKKRFPEKGVMIFFDEPFMVSFGSAYVPISKSEAVSLMNEVLDGLGAIRVVHCCGNTDWSVLFNVDADVINYDAFNFFETIFYFREELAAFLSKGGAISPGIVPSSETVLSCSAEDLARLWRRFGESVEALDPRATWREWFVTPSCGAGSLTPQSAERVLQLLSELDTAISRE
jgi:methionine synthase II (cobalamin-independent)